MKKEEFIKLLKEKLDILDKSEIDDIIEEYTGYIDEKMKNGATEEEAIKDFGDIDELVTELLKAYKINVEKQKKSNNIVNDIVERFLSFIERIVRVFEGKDGNQIFKIVFEIFIIIVGIWLCKIPFHFLKDLGFNVFHALPSGLGDFLFGLWNFIIEFSYLIFGIVLFVKIFERRYLKDVVEEPEIKTNSTKKEKSTKKTENEKRPEPVIVEKRFGVIDALATMCLWFVKFIIICILIGIGGYILGMAVAFGFCVYLWIQGVPYYGIFISILVMLNLGIIFFSLLFNFVINRKNHLGCKLGAIICSLVILGISFSFASVEIANTEFINEMPSGIEMKKITEDLPMKEDYILFNVREYIEDETLGNNLKIEYEYYSMYNIRTDIRIRNQNLVSLDWDYYSYKWNGDITDIIINDLKNKQVHNYGFTPRIKVYGTKENIAKLEANKKNYNNNEHYDSVTHDACERELNIVGHDNLSDYCEKVLYRN